MNGNRPPPTKESRRGLSSAAAPGHQNEPAVYQKHAPMFTAAGRHFVRGLWMIGDECRGLSARGYTSPITGNLSRFYPHRIE